MAACPCTARGCYHGLAILCQFSNATDGKQPCCAALGGASLPLPCWSLSLSLFQDNTALRLCCASCCVRCLSDAWIKALLPCPGVPLVQLAHACLSTANFFDCISVICSTCSRHLTPRKAYMVACRFAHDRMQDFSCAFFLMDRIGCACSFESYSSLFPDLDKGRGIGHMAWAASLASSAQALFKSGGHLAVRY